MKKRCVWAKDDLSIIYHDEEWGSPQHDDEKLFEFLILEGAQAGLSWKTILKRRNGYKKVFSAFNVIKVSKYSQKHIQKILKDESIIRNELKIKSAVNNAKQFLQIQSEFGSFNNYLWNFVNHKQIQNKFKKPSEIPAYTEISKKLSKDLKKRGFSFVGPTICYALMQAIGMVNDHTIDCFRYGKL